MLKTLSHNLKIGAILFLLLLITMSFIRTDTVEKESKITFSKFPKEENITFENLYDYKEGVAGMIACVDSNLIVLNVNFGAEYLLNNYSLRNNKISKGYIRVGKGPGEIVGIAGFGITDNNLWLLDVTLKKILCTNLSEVLSDKSLGSIQKYPLLNDYYEIVFKDSLHYLGVGSNKSKFKIQEVDLRSGKETDEFGIFENVPDNMEFQAFKNAHECLFYGHPNGNKVVLAYRFTDAIDIYNTDTHKGVKIHGPEKFDVDFQPAGNVMYRTDKTRFAFVGGTTSENFIYMCYSGKQTEAPNAYSAKFIYVYDWDGNPVRKLVLDRFVDAIAVSDDEKTLYAYDAELGFLVQTSIN
jgi:hypothetical protein